MKYTVVKNPIWANAEKTQINCEVDFDALVEDFVPFTADPNDKFNASSKEIFDRCVAGDFGNVADYSPPAPPTSEKLAEMIRAERNNRLASTDWTQLPDVPQSTKNVWSAYRQELRDITLQSDFPQNVVWPQPPNAV